MGPRHCLAWSGLEAQAGPSEAPQRGGDSVVRPLGGDGSGSTTIVSVTAPVATTADDGDDDDALAVDVDVDGAATGLPLAARVRLLNANGWGPFSPFSQV